MPGAAGSNFGLTYGYTTGEAWNINSDFARLDALTALTVVSAALTSPPGSPAAGDRYIIAAPASGAWVGKEKQVARYTGVAWEYFSPSTGVLAYDNDGLQVLRYTGSSWIIPVIRRRRTDFHNRPSYDDDSAAAAGGVEIGEEYRNGNFLMVRLT